MRHTLVGLYGRFTHVARPLGHDSRDVSVVLLRPNITFFGGLCVWPSLWTKIDGRQLKEVWNVSRVAQWRQVGMDAIHRQGTWQRKAPDGWRNSRQTSPAPSCPEVLFRIAVRVWPVLWCIACASTAQGRDHTTRRNTASATCFIVKFVMRRLEVVRDVPRVAVATLMDAGLRRRRLERVA